MTKKQTHSETLLEEVDDLFLEMMNFVRNQIIEESIRADVTLSQFKCLYYLLSHGRMKMNDLTHSLCSTHGAATGLVDRLIRMELVSRERCLQDRRVVYVTITEKGIDVIARIKYKRHEIFKHLLSRLSPEESAALYQTLSLFKNKLSHDEK